MGNICSNSGREEKKNPMIEPSNDTEEESPSPCTNLYDDGSPPSLDYPLKMSQQYSMTFDSKIKIDFSDTTDYKAFCLLIHQDVGAVLLHCTRKKKKPPHYQLPGGHVDGDEFTQVTKSSLSSSSVTQEQLYLAARIGCGREGKF